MWSGGCRQLNNSKETQVKHSCSPLFYALEVTLPILFAGKTWQERKCISEYLNTGLKTESQNIIFWVTFLYLFWQKSPYSPAFVFDPCSSTVKVSITSKASCFWSSNELFLESTKKIFSDAEVTENTTLSKDASWYFAPTLLFSLLPRRAGSPTIFQSKLRFRLRMHSWESLTMNHLKS